VPNVFGDCPPGCGGFTIWPRSHARIWQHTRECMRDGRGYHPYQDEALYPRTRAALSSRRIALCFVLGVLMGSPPPAGEGDRAAHAQALAAMKRETPAVETHGPAGTAEGTSA
jgi:hypothetical protein